MKKGLEFSVLVTLIIVLVGGLLLVYYLSSITSEFERKTDIETCRLSIIANAKAEQSLLSLAAPITCPAERIFLRQKDKKVVAADVTKQMKDCWYKMAEGQISVFGRAWTQTKSSCLVCSEFVLTNDLSVNAVKEYLTYKVPHSDQTYLDYFSVLNQPRAPSSDIFFVDVGIDGPKRLETFVKATPYFVLFVRQQRSSLQKFFSSLTDVVSSLMAKITGEELLQDTQTFFIVPREKLTQLKSDNIPLCQDLYWEKGEEYAKQ